MPSSTSSSDAVVPPADYRRFWFWSVVTFAVLLVGSEVHWRSGGHLKSVTDSCQLWSAWREELTRANYAGGRPLAIVGDSRMQLGIVPDVLRRELGVLPSMLAVQGQHGFSTLADLCNDPAFRGIVLCGSMESMFLPENLQDQRRYVEFYRDFWSKPFAAFDQRVNTILKSQLQCLLVAMNPNLIFKRQVMGRFRTAPAYIETHTDRSRKAHYRTLFGEENLAELRRRNVAGMQSIASNNVTREAQFAQVLVNQVAPLISRLHARGGQAIFVKMPVAAEMWELDEQKFPREHYWDRLGPLTGAQAIHFRDYTQLQDFDCPDASHLDAAAAPVFTGALAAVLKSAVGMGG